MSDGAIECVASRCKKGLCCLFGEVDKSFIAAGIKEGKIEEEVGVIGKDGKKYKCDTYAKYGVKVDHVNEEDKLKAEIKRLQAELLTKQIEEGKVNLDAITVAPSTKPVQKKTLKDVQKNTWGGMPK